MLLRSIDNLYVSFEQKRASNALQNQRTNAAGIKITITEYRTPTPNSSLAMSQKQIKANHFLIPALPLTSP
jgi:hypothetical protein